MTPAASVRRVAVIDGEGIGPETLRPTVEVLDGLGLPIAWSYPPVGAEARRRFGRSFPPEARQATDAADAAFFGATSGPSAAALFHLRWGRQTYANVRPVRWLAGARSPLARPEGIDLVIVRENLEDLYVGIEGELDALAPLALESRTARRPLRESAPGRFALKVISEAGSRRVIRFAFELARQRKRGGGRGKLACATKHNMLPRSDGLFRDVALELAADYPDVALETFLADDFGQRLVTRPQELDVVVTPNLYGDLFSDVAAGLVGGLGLAPSGCFGDDFAYFESAHGSAPDIAGRGIANPTATLLSGAMLLEHLGFADAAVALRRAVEEVYAEGVWLTPDQGGRATTLELCSAVRERLSAPR